MTDTGHINDAIEVLEQLAAGAAPSRDKALVGALALEALAPSASRELLDAAQGLRIVASGGSLGLDVAGRQRAADLAAYVRDNCGELVAHAVFDNGDLELEGADALESVADEPAQIECPSCGAVMLEDPPGPRCSAGCRTYECISQRVGVVVFQAKALDAALKIARDYAGRWSSTVSLYEVPAVNMSSHPSTGLWPGKVTFIEELTPRDSQS
jgi:hypothetical protein